MESLNIPGLQYVCEYEYDDYYYYIIAQEPHYQLITYNQKLYYIPLPWVYYEINKYHASHGRIDYMYFGKRLIKETGKLFYPVLPNTYLDTVCYPVKGKIQKSFPSLTKAVTTAINDYWQAGFNDDEDYMWETKFFRSLMKPQYNENPGPDIYHKFFSKWEQLDLEKILKFNWPNNVKITTNPFHRTYLP